MNIQFQSAKLFLFCILATLIVVPLFISTALHIQQQNVLGQIEATGVYNGSATSIKKTEQGPNASSAADTTRLKQEEGVSEYEQTFMEAEISNALNSSSMTNQTTPTPTSTPTPSVVPYTTTAKAAITTNKQGETAGNFNNILNITVGANTYPITYNISGGKVNNITAIQQNSTLVVNLSTNDDGTLTIQLPRNVIDSKGPQNKDEDYLVFVNSIQTEAKEATSNNQTRALSIDFENGAEQIEIARTRIVPEFGNGAISMLLLFVSLTGILAFTARYRKLQYIPKKS
jgi:hypothetical protein